MSDRTDLPAILTRALLAAASARIEPLSDRREGKDLFRRRVIAADGPVDLAAISEGAHRLLADLITLLLLELEGLVDSPLNIRARARVRLGAPSHSRILTDWPEPLVEPADGDLFAPSPAPPPLPIGRDPEAFFRKIIHSARSTAGFLRLGPSAIEEMIRWLLPVIVRCEPDDDPVGWIHAHSQRHRLLTGPGNRLRFQVDRERSRSHGVLYTPPPLTEALVEAVLTVWKREEKSPIDSLFGSVPGSSTRAPRILDPSCGSGQFLLSIMRHLLGERTGKPEEILTIFRGMHGVDIDPGAATLAAFNLSLQAVRALCRSQGADPPMVVGWLQDQIGPGFPWFLGSQIHQGNALLLATTEEGTSFRWADRFADIFTGDRPGFDIVIGNPPWVSYGLRDRAGPLEEQSIYLRRLFTFGAQYKLSLYPLFIELALRLTRPGGLHGFLVPDSFFTGRHFSRIRQHILESTHPILFCLVESGPWPGVHVGHTAFYCVRRLPAPGPPDPVTTCVVQLPPPSKRQRRRMIPTLPLFGTSTHGTRPVPVDLDTFRSAPHHAFRVYRDDTERHFVARLERFPIRLDNLIDTYSGLIARFGQESVTGPRTGEFVLRDRSDEVLIRDPKPESRWKPGLHSGAEVEPFRTHWRGGSLYIPDTPEQLRQVYKSGFDLDRYARPKIFLRQTGDRLVAARDRQGLLCLNNVHILTSRDDLPIDLRFLCGLLLSDTIQRYYQTIALEAGRPLAQVDLATLRTLPFPCDRDGEPFGEAAPDENGNAIESEVRLRVDDALQGGRVKEVLDLVRAGDRGRGGDRRHGGDRRRSTLVLCRLVEILEERPWGIPAREASEALNESIRILFGLEKIDPITD